ncbi:MAG: DUF3048 domain-containing protein, partial [Nitriliruptorales bacterium]
PPTPSPTEPPVVGVAPLTGEPVTDEAVLARPVVAVKVENTAAARPQAGLDAADVVYEELVEGGVTRFMALFQSRVPERVGPIRSGRPEDALVVPAYEGMLFVSGARAEVVEKLNRSGTAWMSHDGKVMDRDPSRRAPHNLFATGEGLFGAAGARVDPATPTGWVFDPAPPPGSVDCPDGCGRGITVPMSNASTTGFTFEPATGLYRRSQNGSPQTVTGPGRVGAANVVVLGVELRDGGCCDTAGSRYTDTVIVGSGAAIVLRDGRRYEGSWAKDSAGAHLRLLGDGDEPLVLKPGPTWILLTPASRLP